MNFSKITVAATLLFGATLLGTTGANAAPLSNAFTNTPHEVATENLIQKTAGRHRRRHRGNNRHRRNRGYRGRRNFALGLGAAALLGGAFIANNNRYYERPRRRVRYGRYQPWSDAWYDDCFRRYRSFNPDTGYYKSYRRGYVFCR